MSPNSLPVVRQETRSALTGEFQDNPNLISDTYQRLMEEQPALTEQIAGYVTERAKNQTEARGMLETFVLTYRLLESQADAEGMSGMFGPQAPEAPES
jgi:ribosomal protein S17E